MKQMNRGDIYCQGTLFIPETIIDLRKLAILLHFSCFSRFMDSKFVYN